MAQLWQEIANVPGLTGSWKERLAQYYKQLTGKNYRGTLDEGLYMLDQIKKGNYAQPQTTPASTPASTDLATGYAQTGVTAGQNASATPQFESVMPFYDAWGRMLPQATDAANSQINPESVRNFNSQYNDYMSGMTSAGGQRFGRALGGVGDLKASAERDRQGQLQDWLNQYQQGYKEIFYNPSRDAWNSAITQGSTPDQTLKEIPTWDKAYQTLSNQYQGGSVNNASPFYG